MGARRAEQSMPGFIARRLEREMMKRSVEDLKREAERRVA